MQCLFQQFLIQTYSVAAMIMKYIYVRDVKLLVKYLVLNRFFYLLRLANMLMVCYTGRQLCRSLHGEPDGLSPWPLPNAISIQGSWEALAHYPQPDVFYFSITAAKWQLMSGTMGICLNLWSMKFCLLKYKYHPRTQTFSHAFVTEPFFLLEKPAKNPETLNLITPISCLSQQIKIREW